MKTFDSILNEEYFYYMQGLFKAKYEALNALRYSTYLDPNAAYKTISIEYTMAIYNLSVRDEIGIGAAEKMYHRIYPKTRAARLLIAAKKKLTQSLNVDDNEPLFAETIKVINDMGEHIPNRMPDAIVFGVASEIANAMIQRRERMSTKELIEDLKDW